MKTVLLKLSGPMQSWGTSSHFVTRNTDYYPSKSAVIGIIAASFGYRRDEDEKIKKLNDLDFAVRVDQVGVLRQDYQIASKYNEDWIIKDTYLTYRYYLEDSVFVVALSSEDKKWMDEIIYALKHPYFQQFMGRRSCPVPIDFVLKESEQEAIDALKNLAWQASEHYQRKNKEYIADIYADKELLDDEPYSTRNDRVVSFSQKERKFGPRFEARTSIKLYYKNDKEDKKADYLGQDIDYFDSLEQ
ncbi:type I-E CRISPR-associated protein Cas5/CasD [Anaerosphaera sp. HMSC064C01]|nr:type I-E CRISPR-associated protein Cas5/CasD [Anaerosphaera sp. HMSC064C01]